MLLNDYSTFLNVIVYIILQDILNQCGVNYGILYIYICMYLTIRTSILHICSNNLTYISFIIGHK